MSYDRPSLYSPLDYLLCRTYDAANKLYRTSPTRVATMILTDYSAFALQLKKRWIQWDNPRLFRGDQDIQPFLYKFLQKYPDFENDMGSRFKTLEQIWILRDTCDLGLKKEFCIDPVTGHQV